MFNGGCLDATKKESVICKVTRQLCYVYVSANKAIFENSLETEGRKDLWAKMLLSYWSYKGITYSPLQETEFRMTTNFCIGRAGYNEILVVLREYDLWREIVEINIYEQTPDGMIAQRLPRESFREDYSRGGVMFKAFMKYQKAPEQFVKDWERVCKETGPLARRRNFVELGLKSTFTEVPIVICSMVAVANESNPRCQSFVAAVNCMFNEEITNVKEAKLILWLLKRFKSEGEFAFEKNGECGDAFVSFSSFGFFRYRINFVTPAGEGDFSLGGWEYASARL